MRTLSHPTAPLLTALLVALGAASTHGCLQAESTVCSWGHVCPAGLVCDPVGQTCIHPSQAEICRGLPDGEGCLPTHDTQRPHLCLGEVCRPSLCGDGITDTRPQVGEVCDDGNQTAGDGCRADCRGLERCLDGLVDAEAGEECDDGNLDENDQCTTDCTRVRCGDNVLSGLEECDDGDAALSDSLPDACRSDCTLPGCADGVVDTDDARHCWPYRGQLQVALVPGGLETADFDGNGYADLLVANGDRHLFEVYLSLGDATWIPAPGSPYALPSDVELSHLAVGRLDGDALPDVVVAASEPFAQSTLRVYLTDAAGAPALHGITDITGRGLNHLAIADFDGDGSGDLVGFHDDTCSVDVRLGDGAGGLGAPLFSDVSWGHCWATAMRAAKLDGDEHMDLVVTTGDDGVFVMQGGGDGTFTTVPAAVPYPAGEVRDLAVADVNGDGRPDLIYPEQRPPKTPVHVLLNQGGFQFAAAPGGPPELGLASMRLDVGDIDGNGTMDLAAIDYLAQLVFVLLGAGDGTFTVHVPPPESMAMSADDVVFGLFYDDPFGGLALLKVAERRVALYHFNP